MAPKILVAGLGSMGKRRVRNLQFLGVDVIGLDISEERRKQSSDIYGITTYGDIKAALADSPDAMVISVPPHIHKEYAISAIGQKIPFFTEVNTMPPDDMREIIDLCSENGTRGMPSCNVAFHPSVCRIASMLEGGMIGKPLLVHFHSGSYLPDWHPWEGLSDYYVGKKETGGGRDIIMWDLSWLSILLGKPRTVFAHTKKLGDFDADIFDTYALQMELEGGVLASVVVNLIQRPPLMHLEIIGTNGTIKWDGGTVSVWDSSGRSTYPEEDDRRGYPVEQPKPGFASKDLGMTESYIDEMKAFLDVVNGAEPRFTLEDEMALLNTMYEAEASSETGERRSAG